MSETHIAAQTTEHDVAIAEAQADAAVEIAETQAEAATEIAETQADAAASGEAEEWRSQLDSLRTSHEAERHATETALNALREEHRQMAETLLLIQSQQAPTPEAPENPESEPSEADRPAEEVREEAEEAEEPKPPERKRAHRWI